MKRLLFLCLLAACNPNSAPPVDGSADSARPDGTELDTASLPQDTANLGVNTPAPRGFYYTALPGEGSRGLTHTVLFRPDLSFVLQEGIAGRETSDKRHSGRWRPDNGTLRLMEGTTEVGQYRWKGDTLVLLREGREYPLSAAPAAADNPSWSVKRSEGVEWVGVGTEPFWNVEIDEGKAVRFHLAEWGEPRTFKWERPLVSTDSVVYRAGPDTARLRVTVYPTFCSDGMSDFTYTHSIRVEWKRQVLRGCAVEVGSTQPAVGSTQ